MTNDDANDPEGMLSIAAVERDCGLPKDTLRVWERRYGFPTPVRDRHGERLYPTGQVATLRRLRRLIDAGHRPGQVVGRSDEELSELSRSLGFADVEAVGFEARQVLQLLAAYDAFGLREMLNAIMLRVGLSVFAANIGPTLAAAVGAAWSRGELEIHQEHLFTEQFTTALRSAINAAQVAVLPRRPPRVLLSTIPGEPHALGLLMAEAMFTVESCLCISLGVQTPIRDIAAAAKAHNSDIIALSFSATISASKAMAGLAELREIMAPRVEIWAGGSCSGLRSSQGLLLIQDLSVIASKVGAWRFSAKTSAD